VFHVEVRAVLPRGGGVELRHHLGTWFKSEGDDLVFRSALPDTVDVNEHLKWFDGLLQFDRKILRRIDEQGANMVIRILTDSPSFKLSPEAVLLAHRLHLPIEITVR
jgi:hypothetical protein